MSPLRLPIVAILVALALLAASVARAADKGCGCKHGADAAKAARQDAPSSPDAAGHDAHAGHRAEAASPGAAEADPHAAHRAAAAAAETSAAPAAAATEIRFPDEKLLDERGASRTLPDVLSDRIVVLDFIFTSCTTVCPVLSGIMSGVQQGLGDAKDVSLVSLSVDPARDTPPRLEAYAKRWNAKPGWTFLTGEREAVKRVLEAAGAYTADFTAHPPMVLVGDARTGQWVRLNGFPKKAQVLATVEALRAQRKTVAASAVEVKP